MAAALPSDVGLKRQNLACLLSFCKNLHGSEHARALQLGERVVNHGRLHDLLKSVVRLELSVAETNVGCLNKDIKIASVTRII